VSAAWSWRCSRAISDSSFHPHSQASACAWRYVRRASFDLRLVVGERVQLLPLCVEQVAVEPCLLREFPLHAPSLDLGSAHVELLLVLELRSARIHLFLERAHGHSQLLELCKQVLVRLARSAAPSEVACCSFSAWASSSPSAVPHCSARNTCALGVV